MVTVKKKWFAVGTTLLMLGPTLTIPSQVLAAEEAVAYENNEDVQLTNEGITIERTQTVFANTRASFNVHSDIGDLTFVSSNPNVARVDGVVESGIWSGSSDYDYMVELKTDNPGSTIIYGLDANNEVVQDTVVLIEVVSFNESYLNEGVTPQELTIEYYDTYTEIGEYGEPYTYYYVVNNEIIDADHQLKTVLDNGEDGFEEFQYYTKSFTSKTPGTTQVYGFRDGNHIETYEVTVNLYEYTSTEYVTREIPFKVSYVEDDTLAKGEEVVETEGVNGVVVDEYNVSYMGGGEVGRTLVETVITKEPVNKVVRIGVAENYTPLYEDYPVGYAWDFGVWSNYENGTKVASSFNDFAGQKLTIVKEASDRNNHIWVLFQVEGETIGWVSKTALRSQLPKVDVLYTDTSVADAWNFGVWTDYENGTKVSGSLNNHRGKTLHIIAEATDKNGAPWVQFQVDDRTIGWVSQWGLEKNKPVIPVLYTDQVVSDAWNFGVWSSYENGTKLPGSLNNYAGKTLSIIAEEVDSNDNEWVQFQVDGATIGWVSKWGLAENKPALPVLYTDKPVSDAWNYGVWSNYEKGTKLPGSLNNYAGKTLSIVAEATDANGTPWVQFQVDGKTVGWVSKKGITTGEVNIPDYYYSVLPVTQAWNYGIWSNYENGSYVTSLNDYAGRFVRVVEEAKVGSNNVWAKITVDGKDIGWVSKRGLRVGNPYSHILYSRKPVANAWDYSVWSKPTNGTKVGGSLNDHVGRTLNVIEESTVNGTKWVRFEHQGRAIGWVARQGLER